MIHIQLFVGSRLWNIPAEMSLVRLASVFLRSASCRPNVAVRQNLHT